MFAGDLDNASHHRSVPADCLYCGVCCFSTLDTYIRVTGEDWERMGDGAERLAHFIGNKAYMKMSPAGHCAALRVERETARFFCTAYEKRPETCRALGRGSPECQGELAEKGGRPSGALNAPR